MSLSDAFRVLFRQMVDGTEPINELFASDLHWRWEELNLFSKRQVYKLQLW